MSNRKLIFVVLGYVIVSHLILPIFNQARDFLVFSTWNMYSRSARSETAVDLTWDGGKTFFLRDYREKVKEFGISLVPVVYLLSIRDIRSIRELHKEKLLNLCRCDSISYVILKNDFYSHILKKEEPEKLEIQVL